MTDLIKTGELASRYSISTRTLRYYEEMGLIESQRINDYAYRMYDDANVKKLEQILILRKLNIGIKDIQRIFNTAGSDVVLDVLRKKVEDIDEEAALLHELKEIVITFIRQIEQADFSSDSDVKLLYDKAKEIETQLVSAKYTGNSSPVNRLFEVAERLEEKAASRLIVPENIMKRMLQNVYFIWGDGAEVAKELGRRHNIYVYHTCDNRAKHTQNADPKYQPGLFRFEMDMPNYFLQDPEDALQREQDIVRDFTPMVIMDLIQLTTGNEKVICENDIDIDSIISFVTHAVMITNNKTWADYTLRYKNEIHRLDISTSEKEKLTSKADAVWGEGKPEYSRAVAQYGVKNIVWDDDSTVEQTADMIAEYFGFC